MRKYNVFIGSSSESIEIAEAIQQNLSTHANLLPICWNQGGVFNVSNFILEDIFYQLHISAFGIFVLSNDDKIIIRKKTFAIVRDNVLFEMGLFMGALGKDRTYFLIPKSPEINIRIPSDLSGLNYAVYDPNNLQNVSAMVGPACTAIKKKIDLMLKTPPPNVVIDQFGDFNDFDNLYSDLFEKAKRITTSFIHSRRWRENNLISINQFFCKNGVCWDVILPDVNNEVLLNHLQQHFNDGLTIKDKIIDAYDFFLQFKKKYPKKINIFLYGLYPTYTFYKFDNTLIISMYPLTNDRRPTPTFKISSNAIYADFFHKDIERIIGETKPITVSHLSLIVNEYKDSMVM